MGTWARKLACEAVHSERRHRSPVRHYSLCGLDAQLVERAALVTDNMASFVRVTGVDLCRGHAAEVGILGVAR
jgi:hypothetical protein